MPWGQPTWKGPPVAPGWAQVVQEQTGGGRPGLLPSPGEPEPDLAQRLFEQQSGDFF